MLGECVERPGVTPIELRLGENARTHAIRARGIGRNVARRFRTGNGQEAEVIDNLKATFLLKSHFPQQYSLSYFCRTRLKERFHFDGYFCGFFKNFF